jgi:hypothetical protein
MRVIGRLQSQFLCTFRALPILAFNTPLVLLGLWASQILIGLVKLMIGSPHLILFITLASHLFPNLAKRNQQLHYPKKKLTIMVEFLIIKNFFGFDNS